MELMLTNVKTLCNVYILASHLQFQPSPGKDSSRYSASFYSQHEEVSSARKKECISDMSGETQEVMSQQ